MSNAFYNNIKFRNPAINAAFKERFPDAKTLIENLFLQALVEAYPRVKVQKDVNNLKENAIRDLFIADFKYHNALTKAYIENKVITFASENQANTQSLNQRTDIEFHSNFHQIDFVIECKRLSSVETRYVQGSTKNGQYEIDGLEKFIHLIYAEKNHVAAMIGFIVSGNINNICVGLQNKVKLFKPAANINNFINEKSIDWQYSFQSAHLRNNSTELLLHHFFFDFSN